MAFFDKKFCDICGAKIGLLGNHKLSDGNMCKECAKKMSPFMTGRKQYSVAEMKEHLAYREANQQRVASFNPTRTFGIGTKVYLDDNQGLMVVSSKPRYREDNADLIEFNQVTGCDLDIQESRREVKRKDSEGKEVSYVPARYKYEYDFYIVIHVGHPWFNQIRFRVNQSTIEGKTSMPYKETDRKATELRDALQNLHQEVRASAAEAAKPKTSVNCPGCGASTLPDANGRCEYCGFAIS